MKFPIILFFKKKEKLVEKISFFIQYDTKINLFPISFVLILQTINTSNCSCLEKTHILCFFHVFFFFSHSFLFFNLFFFLSFLSFFLLYITTSFIQLSFKNQTNLYNYKTSFSLPFSSTAYSGNSGISVQIDLLYTSSSICFHIHVLLLQVLQ